MDRQIIKKNLFFETVFNYDSLKNHDDGVQYENINAKHIVFAELIKENSGIFQHNTLLIPEIDKWTDF